MQIMTGDDSMSDDVFEQDEDKTLLMYSPEEYAPPPSNVSFGSTGYRDYKPPAEVYVINQPVNLGQAGFQDKVWSSNYAQSKPSHERTLHKVCIFSRNFVKFFGIF